MKNKLYIILILALAISSCTNYLSVKPQGKVIPETDEEFASLIHNQINKIEGGEDMLVIGNFETILLNESFSDNFDANVKIGNIPAYAGDKINTKQYNYKGYFEIIRDCNIVIENIGDRETELAKKTCAAAYALKGICYYNLIREYCPPYDKTASEQLGIPIIDRFDMEEMPARASLKNTIDYTEQLLLKSISYNINDKFFLINSDAAKAYLAKLYFWTSNWTSTIKLCQELLENKAYKLASIAEYEQVMQAKNAWGQEIIIRSHINNNSDIDWYYVTFIKDLKTRPVNATLVKLFDRDKENDVRYSMSFDKKRLNQKNLSAKVRGSELVLMLAESYYHNNLPDKALEQLNYLRRNRIKNVSDYTLASLEDIDNTQIIKTDVNGKALSKLLNAIFIERRKELYAEGDRWFELKRNGRPEMWIINNGLKYTTKQYLYTAPIYKGDIDLNKNLIQNEGYK